MTHDDPALARLATLEKRLARRRRELVELPREAGLFTRLFASAELDRKAALLAREVRSLEREVELLMLGPPEVPDDLPAALDALDASLADLQTHRADGLDAVDALWEPAHLLFAIAEATQDDDLTLRTHGLRARSWVVDATTMGPLCRDLRALLQAVQRLDADSAEDDPVPTGDPRSVAERLASIRERLDELDRTPPETHTRIRHHHGRNRLGPATTYQVIFDPAVPARLRPTANGLVEVATELGDSDLRRRASAVLGRVGAVQASGWRLSVHEQRALLKELEARVGQLGVPAPPADARIREQLELARTALGKLAEGYGSMAPKVAHPLVKAAELLGEQRGEPVPEAIEVSRFMAWALRTDPPDPAARAVTGMALVTALEQHLDRG